MGIGMHKKSNTWGLIQLLLLKLNKTKHWHRHDYEMGGRMLYLLVTDKLQLHMGLQDIIMDTLNQSADINCEL